ncbi:MAG TPA: cation:proton antiporter [Terriglobales bacterium]|nr:cation:proton antiporter [Terriglobales bacterium]
MTTGEFGSFTLVLLLILAAAHLCGYIFQRLRQPRVVGEIVAGILIGPSFLGHFAPRLSASLFGAAGSGFQAVLFFLYNLGLLLLMFHSGAETHNLFGRGDRKETTWLAGVGTGLPFLLGLLAAPWLPLDWLMGPARQHSSLVLVLGIAIAVTSIPVISRIFYDLRILHTRFARLVLGVAVLEDIVLWAVLGIATALAKSGVIPRHEIVNHVAATLVFFVAGLALMPRLLRRINTARWNVLSTASPAGYLVLVLFLYSAVASAFDVSLVFAAFLAGFAVGADQLLPADALASLGRVSFAVFIPIYFAIVGYRLDLGKDFSLSMLALFVAGGCVVKLMSAGIGARLARFRGLDVINLALALNARGGPGIVLASVAYDAGIINGAFFTTLVLMAIITSQVAGAWLEYVLRKGWPLLSGHPEEAALAAEPIAPNELAA